MGDVTLARPIATLIDRCAIGKKADIPSDPKSFLEQSRDKTISSGFSDGCASNAIHTD